MELDRMKEAIHNFIPSFMELFVKNLSEKVGYFEIETDAGEGLSRWRIRGHNYGGWGIELFGAYDKLLISYHANDSSPYLGLNSHNVEIIYGSLWRIVDALRKIDPQAILAVEAFLKPGE
jgi:hypothetical protein